MTTTMQVEEYNEYGEIKPKPKSGLSSYYKHRIHQTKDIFDGECYLCQRAIEKQVKTYWEDGE